MEGLLVVAAVVGVLMFWRWDWVRRERERQAWFFTSRCLGCGYELRGSGDRCPECGRSIWDERGSSESNTPRRLL